MISRSELVQLPQIADTWHGFWESPGESVASSQRVGLLEVSAVQPGCQARRAFPSLREDLTYTTPLKQARVETCPDSFERNSVPFYTLSIQSGPAFAGGATDEFPDEEAAKREADLVALDLVRYNRPMTRNERV